MALATHASPFADTLLGGRLHDLRAALTAWVARRRAYRAALSELRELSDRELLDMGLSRYDLQAVAADAARAA